MLTFCLHHVKLTANNIFKYSYPILNIDQRTCRYELVQKLGYPLATKHSNAKHPASS